MQQAEELLLLLPQLIAMGWWPLLWSGLKAHKPLKEMSGFPLHRVYPTLSTNTIRFSCCLPLHTISQLHCRAKVYSAVLVARSCWGGFRWCLPPVWDGCWVDIPVPAEENLCWDLTPSGHTLVCQISLNMVPKLLLLWSSFAIIRHLCPQTPGGWDFTHIWVLLKLPGKETH